MTTALDDIAMKPLRRRDRKKLDLFKQDHCWGWRPPMILRKIHCSCADLDRIISLRDAYIEADRKRMVARGLTQYAKPGELDQPNNTPTK